MYTIKCENIEFTGYKDDCWKFIVGFLGVSMEECMNKYDIEEFDGVYTDYGIAQIKEK